jgi:mono/diheme cytochrome c family protein
MRAAWIIAGAVLAWIGGAGGAPAGYLEPGDVEAGRQIAERLCAGCHAMGAGDESSHPAAPPLRTFAERWPLEHLEEAFAEGITVGHHDIPMPEFILEPDEIADLIAFLDVVGRE